MNKEEFGEKRERAKFPLGFVIRKLFGWFSKLALLIIVIGVGWLFFSDCEECTKTKNVKFTIPNLSGDEPLNVAREIVNDDFKQDVIEVLPQYRDTISERIALKINTRTDASSGESLTEFRIGFKYQQKEDLSEDAELFASSLKERVNIYLSRLKWTYV